MTVLSLFQQYGVGSRSKKHKFQTKLDIENFRSILIWSENVDSGVKLDTSNLSNVLSCMRCPKTLRRCEPECSRPNPSPEGNDG